MSGDGEPAEQADAPAVEAAPPAPRPLFQKRTLSKGNKQDFPRVRTAVLSGRHEPPLTLAAERRKGAR